MQFELSDDVVNVGLVLGHTTVRNRVLAVRRICSAVTVWKIVDDEGAHHRRAGSSIVERLDVVKVFAHNWDLGVRVHPEESWNLGDLLGLSG